MPLNPRAELKPVSLVGGLCGVERFLVRRTVSASSMAHSISSRASANFSLTASNCEGQSALLPSEPFVLPSPHPVSERGTCESVDIVASRQHTQRPGGAASGPKP